jgi:hypothetical protein
VSESEKEVEGMDKRISAFERRIMREMAETKKRAAQVREESNQATVWQQEITRLRAALERIVALQPEEPKQTVLLESGIWGYGNAKGRWEAAQMARAALEGRGSKNHDV